jgi:hypothetical protein
MGHLLHSSCWICSEENEGLLFGTGFIRQVPIVPALDKSTLKVCAVAYGDHEHYNYYTDPKMYELPDEPAYIEWGELRLSRENNYCPECEEFSMDFEVIGEWD